MNLTIENSKMDLKNIFKNKAKMTTENTEKQFDLTDDVAETTTTETQVPAEEISVEEKLTQDLAAEKDKFLRLFAEFENYKRRTSKERIELYKTANQDVLQAVLPVLDDFDRGIVEIRKAKDKSLTKGVELIHEKLKSVLVAKGLEEVEIKNGDVFNADFAEAITHIPAPTEKLKGKIVDVIEKGYKLGDKVIRFPKVVIGM
jgi:molecular chaperone GrpE